MKELLIKAGIKNLKTFGYPGVDADNILTDMIYKEFFKSMLVTTKHDAGSNKEIVSACDELILSIGESK